MRLYSDLNRVANAESQKISHSHNLSLTLNGDSHPSDPDVFGQPMELDEPFNNGNGDGEGILIDTAADGWFNGRNGVVDGDDGVKESAARNAAIKQQNESIKYGSLLKEEFKDAGSEAERALTEGLGMYAYADPWESPFSKLLDEAGRVSVAEDVNAAILGMCLLYLFCPLILAFQVGSEDTGRYIDQPGNSVIRQILPPNPRAPYPAN